METASNLVVSSPNIKYADDFIFSEYAYEETLVTRSGDDILAKAYRKQIGLRTQRRVGKVGVMLVGWGGNNGSTFTAAVLANRHQLSWNTKNGVMDSNWFGSITQASTVRLGIDEKGSDVYVPMCNLLPMVHPDDLVIDGWDISPLNLAESMARAKVIDFDLQQKLRKEMAAMKPRPAIYDPDFIAANQADRAMSLIRGTRYEQYLQIRADIKDFRDRQKLDKIIVLWTANTERFCEVRAGVHDTSDNLEKALRNNESEISPSTIFALASIDEGCSYINGSPQNTLVPGVVSRAEARGVFVAGDDFKSGQTKLKSVLVDFLVQAGLKPVSIVSYNHLGNNDGKNLSAPKQFRSKEITKSNVVDDMVDSNRILYKPGEKPDHVVVIKYVPYVGDSKRAMDEYTSEILLHGANTIVVHNTCEDSLLAVPLILDLVILAELFTRVSFREDDTKEWQSMHAVLSPLAYLLKAPLVPADAPVINALFKQRACIENILRACLALPPVHNMQLEHKVPFLMKELRSGAMFSEGCPPIKKQKLAHENGDMSDSEYDNSPVRVETPKPKKKTNRRKPATDSLSAVSVTPATSVDSPQFKKRKVNLFAIIKEEEEKLGCSKQRATANTSASSFTTRVSSGQVRRAANLTGNFYIDLKVYKTEDWLAYKPEERYKKALTYIKLQTEPETSEWDAIQRFIGLAHTRFQDSESVFYKEANK